MKVIRSIHAPRTRRSAFTLVEILIAIGLLGLVIAAIYSSWTAILRASKVGLEAAAKAQRSRIAIRTLEDSFGSAMLYVAGQRHYGFICEGGSDASLSFVARLAKSFPRGGKFGDLDVRRVTFSLESGSDGTGQLVLRQQPLLMEMDVDEREHPLVLAKEVKQLKCEFWDSRLNDWVDEWKQTNQLPKCVKLTLKIGEGTREQQEQITRIISLPAVAVQPGWQSPMQPGGLPNQPGIGNPNQPGIVNPNQPGIVNPNQPPRIQLPNQPR
jgi:type II secretion system protein J